MHEGFSFTSFESQPADKCALTAVQIYLYYASSNVTDVSDHTVPLQSPGGGGGSR